MADLGGQLMVHQHERKRVELRRVAMVEPISVPFFDLPWTEAIAEFRRLGILSENELSRLLDDYRDRSEQARQLMLAQLQQRVRDNVIAALQQGQTFAQFADAVQKTGAGLGITVENDGYLRTVFRTNVQTAYGAGRFRAMTQPEVVEERPFVQYRTVGDIRVRESHRLLDGRIFDATSTEWHRIAPPNGFNCRCSMVTLATDEVPDGAPVLQSVPEEYEAEQTFDRAPVALVQEAA